MSIGTIQRAPLKLELTIASGATRSNAVDISRYAGLALYVPDDYDSNTTLTWEVAHALDGDYIPLTAWDDGSAISATITAAEAIDVPESVAKWPYIRALIGDAATQAETLWLVGKS